MPSSTPIIRPNAPRTRCALLLATLCAAGGLRAQEANPAETERRAAVLRALIVLKILPYLTLPKPAEARTELRIGVVGEDEVAVAMRKDLPGRKLGEQTVAVRDVVTEAATKAEPGHGCDVLWLAGSLDDETVRRIVAAHRARPVVLVAERAGFATGGGGLQLFVQDNGVKFEVNADALKQQGVRANPQLLKIARKGPER